MNKLEFNKNLKERIFKKSVENFVDDLERDLIRTCADCMVEYDTKDNEPVNPIYAYFHGQKTAYEYVVQNIKSMIKDLEIIKGEMDVLSTESCTDDAKSATSEEEKENED